MKQYAVIGNPIKHSRSPEIHQQFAAQTSISLNYERMYAEQDAFIDTVERFFQQGGHGLNVTVPFKQEAWQYCQKAQNQLSQRALNAGAVNTIKRNDDGTLYGDNTDGIGLVSDIKNNHLQPIKNTSILILGAGGAVRGVLEPMLDEQCTQIHIANRTFEKAQTLCRIFNDPRLSASNLENIPHKHFDIIINATSASLSGNSVAIADDFFTQDSFIYDMMYAAQDTAFIAHAKKLGCQNCHDGLGMLVEQAAHAFLLWHGVMPKTQKVIDSLRDNLRNSL